MTDFKVGDRVRRRDGSDMNHYHVAAASTLFADEVLSIVQLGSDSCWYPAADFEHAPELKPQYRLRNSVNETWAKAAPTGGVPVVVIARVDSPAALSAVRAALDALHPEGWEEVR